MENEFIIELNSSTDFNFMIYLQNIYLNQSEEMEFLKHPYLPSTLFFTSNFEIEFQKVWKEIVQREVQKDKKIFLW